MSQEIEPPNNNGQGEDSRLEQLADAFAELQAEVGRVEHARGTQEESVEDKLLIMTEEVFEIIKVLRYRSGIATASRFDRSSLSDEIADLLFVTAAIANRSAVDLSDLVKGRRTPPSCLHFDPIETSSREVALQLALRLSAECLRALTLTGSLAVDGVRPAEPRSAIANVIGAASDLADLESIDMFEAIQRKLNKDQLRLWDHSTT